MSPDFKHRFECLLSTSFHQSYVTISMHSHPSPSIFGSSAMILFIYLVPLCTSVLRRLAVCNTPELMLCWCILPICISGSSLLSKHSYSFAISTAKASSNCIRPRLLYFLRIYKRSTSAFVWCCPWTYSIFLVFMSSFRSFPWNLLVNPKLYPGTSTAHDPIAWISFFALTLFPGP